MSLTWPDYLPEIDGERRFKGTRITPWVLLHFYSALGYSAEMLAMEYPSVTLPIIHKFIAFYLENAAEIDALAKSEEDEIDRLRAAAPNHSTLADIRQRLIRVKPLSA